MDALTVKEETGLPFSSENEGVMHACGHDCHISAMLATAKLLNDHKDELCGTVKLAFQPAEEIAKGAIAMVEAGALEGVDGCFAIHVWSSLSAGTVSVSAGPAWQLWISSPLTSRARAATVPHPTSALTRRLSPAPW